MKKVYLKVRDHQGADKEVFIDARPGGALGFNSLGDPISLGAACTELFELLPAAAVALGTSKLILASGTGTEVIARSVKGGANFKTQATTPAQGDNVLYSAVATTAMELTVRAGSGIQHRAVVNLTSIATVFASFGLSELITDADPGGTAGDGAMFLFVPSGNVADLTVSPALTTAQYANWIVAEKVAGADTFTATTIPVVAGQDYELMVEIGDDRKARYYIDGVLVATSPNALTNNATLRVFGGLEKRDVGGTQRDFDVRALSLGRLWA